MGFLRRNTRPGLSTNRLEAFSDGVFSIAITLLVLEITVPALSSVEVAHGQLLKDLIDLWPKFLSFFISFSIIGIFWVGHNIMFRFIKRSDRTLLWLNILLLMFVSFIPFPAALLGEYGAERTATVLYGSTVMVLGLIYFIVWKYATFKNRLVDSNLDPKMIRQGSVIVLAAPLLYFAAILLAFVSPILTLIIYIFIPILYVIPSPVDEFVDYAFDKED